MPVKPAPHEFSADDIQVVTGISIDLQKDIRKRIAARGLKPLGRFQGHWLYTLADMCMLNVIEAVKNSGAPVDAALSIVLGDPSVPASMDRRRKIELAVIAPIIGVHLASDVILYIPDQNRYAPVLSIKFDGNRPIGGDPDITATTIMDLDWSTVSVSAINISRVVLRIIENEDRMRPVLDDLEAVKAKLREEFAQ